MEPYRTEEKPAPIKKQNILLFFIAMFFKPVQYLCNLLKNWAQHYIPVTLLFIMPPLLFIVAPIVIGRIMFPTIVFPPAETSADTAKVLSVILLLFSIIFTAFIYIYLFGTSEPSENGTLNAWKKGKPTVYAEDGKIIW